MGTLSWISDVAVKTADEAIRLMFEEGKHNIVLYELLLNCAFYFHLNHNAEMRSVPHRLFSEASSSRRSEGAYRDVRD